MKTLLLIISILLPLISKAQKATIFNIEKGEIRKVSGDRFISGIYPHLTTYSHGFADQLYRKDIGAECGIGAIVEWYGKLYMINYADHKPHGSPHKLYIIDENLNMKLYEHSVGGTPAARMIHKESNQLLIGHYVIDAKGEIRVIDIRKMPGRITAIARHLKEPKNKVYYYDMEGMLYEVDINTLSVSKLFHNPLPGWHGKGAYTAQGVLVLANNGEAQGSLEPEDDWKVSPEGMKGKEMNGVLAEFDGEKFKVIERKQFTDVTTKHGVNAIPNDNSPLWSMGWDKRSVLLMVKEKGTWKKYRLPKATTNNDPSHGWFTEWPRIREIAKDKYMMDMHGMFFDFPKNFSPKKSAGIRAFASHLRYIPDFTHWNNRIVLATDESSVQGNPMTGQPQSNLWFGTKEELNSWGPATGYGAVALNDSVKKGWVSDPYLLAGFDKVTIHFVNHGDKPIKFSLSIDKKGNDKWNSVKNFELAQGEYNPYQFDEELNGEWFRIEMQTEGIITASVHSLNSRDYNKNESSIFEGLASINDKNNILGGKLFTNAKNFNMSIFASVVKEGHTLAVKEKEFNKMTFSFTEGITDSLAIRAQDTRVKYLKSGELGQLWEVDEASVILKTKRGTYRLPLGNKSFDKTISTRSIRELESEREIANIHGTFYELGLEYIGLEPYFNMMRPISSHNYYIDDMNTWNGLLCLTGVSKKAKENERIYRDNEAAVWLGGIDDLWKLGKPVGYGGPLSNTEVKANIMSDPYLMSGYDKKSLSILSDKNCTISLYLIINHYMQEPVLYKSFKVNKNEKLNYRFPDGFSAHWAMVKSDTDCTVSTIFTYE